MEKNKVQWCVITETRKRESRNEKKESVEEDDVKYMVIF